jgi:general secretion pathway protein D
MAITATIHPTRGNLVLIHDAGGYRIMPASEAAGSGGLDVASADKSPEPGFGVTAIPLQYVSVQTISKLIEGFAVKAGTIRADPSGNLLLVTGNGDERRKAVDTVLSFDVDWLRGQSIGVYPVRNSSPEPLISELEKIMDSGEGGLGHDIIKFQAISRMNAILVVARKPEMLRKAGSWISRLDNSEMAANGVKVYRVRYGDARQLAKLLTSIFGGGSGANSGLDAPSNQLAPSAGTTTLSALDRLSAGVQQQPAGGAVPPHPGAMAAGGADVASAGNDLGGMAPGSRLAPGTGASIMPGLRITADTVNNAVLVYANEENYRIIERALHQLDRPQLQVAIDLTIAEVTLNDNLNYGVQFFLNSKDVGFNNPDKGSLINTAAASTILGQTLPGANLLIGSQVQPRLIINALHGYTDVKVLSNPSLVVVDNQVATLQVGDQVPVSTGSATVLSANNTVVNTVDYKNTGIILRVQPRINSNGTVLLDVDQEISNVADNNSSGSLTPTLSERKVKSSIMVTSGQTVLLAGLISESQNRGRSSIPVLDSLPVIGDAFTTSNTKGNLRTELIIFIRPQIIRDSVDASFVAEELRSKMKGGKIGSAAPPGAVVPNAPRVVR